MMNMMNNMNYNQGYNNKGGKNNMFVRRAKERGGNRRRGPNRRRGGNNYERKSNYNNDGTTRDNKPQPKKPRVRLDSDNFPSLPQKQILAQAKKEGVAIPEEVTNNLNLDIGVAGELSGKSFPLGFRG